MQINIFGDNEVNDFEGTAMNERKLARKLVIHFTPTTSFYGAGGKELFRMPGYFKPRHYRNGFKFVIDKGPQRNEIFPRWLMEQKKKKKKPGSVPGPAL
jgi:thioredoxin-related protein